MTGLMVGLAVLLVVLAVVLVWLLVGPRVTCRTCGRRVDAGDARLLGWRVTEDGTVCDQCRVNEQWDGR
jgi:hypothetical protein